MNTGKNWIFLIAVGLFVLGSPSHLFAYDNQYTRETLRDVKGVHVLVEIQDGKERDNKATARELQKVAELELRTAGIKVLSEHEAEITAGNPRLLISVISFDMPRTTEGTKGCCYTLEISLWQRVSLDRNPAIDVSAPTWGINIIGRLPYLYHHHLQTIVKKYIDTFINAYLSVNPRIKVPL